MNLPAIDLALAALAIGALCVAALALGVRR